MSRAERLCLYLTLLSPTQLTVPDTLILLKKTRLKNVLQKHGIVTLMCILINVTLYTYVLFHGGQTMFAQIDEAHLQAILIGTTEELPSSLDNWKDVYIFNHIDIYYIYIFIYIYTYCS